MQNPADNVGARLLLSLDANKAYDSMEWRYLWAVLEKFGFGFISWVRLMYSHPQAFIREGSRSSTAFDLGRGTRQGCPVSPLLFALARILAPIRALGGVEGFQYGNIHKKILLYVDDRLLLLQ